MTGRRVVADTRSEAGVCRLCAGGNSSHIHRPHRINIPPRICRTTADADKAKSLTMGIRLQRAGAARAIRVRMSPCELNEEAWDALSERGDSRVLFKNGWS
jgi:hypothetical protein